MKVIWQKKDILNLLNTNHLEDCKHLNPTGENCDILFKNAIQFAYNQKEKGEKQWIFGTI